MQELSGVVTEVSQHMRVTVLLLLLSHKPTWEVELECLLTLHRLWVAVADTPSDTTAKSNKQQAKGGQSQASTRTARESNTCMSHFACYTLLSHFFPIITLPSHFHTSHLCESRLVHLVQDLLLGLGLLHKVGIGTCRHTFRVLVGEV